MLYRFIGKLLVLYKICKVQNLHAKDLTAFVVHRHSNVAKAQQLYPFDSYKSVDGCFDTGPDVLDLLGQPAASIAASPNVLSQRRLDTHT